MAKDQERKRKLEEQAENTPKRVKKSQADSAKKSNRKSDASPQVEISRDDGITKIKVEATTTTPLAKKASKKSRKSDVESTPAETATATPKPTSGATTPAKSESKSDANIKTELLSSVEADVDANPASTSKKSKDTLEQIRSKEEKKQRSREKKARRNAERDVKAGVKEDEQLSAPNENGWWLSPPSAGRFLDHDPIFIRDENGEECLIAATIREVKLLHVNSSSIVRTHTVPDGRAVQCFSLSARYQDHVDIAYDNGAKLQWNWTTGATTESTYPGQDLVVASATESLQEGTPESFYISHAQGNFNINGGRKLLYSTYRPLKSIQVLKNASYIVCYGTTVLILGRRKEQSDSYIWIEMPLTVPPQCIDARAIVQTSKKGKAMPAELFLAVGNAEGKIFLYSDLASLFSTPSQAKLPPHRTLHWHREAVSTVKFSRDGNYLISGGKESVLVIWQLQTAHKQFLPHLTAEVERVVISPDGTRYALQMGDNSIMILSTTELKPVANFAGLQLPVQTETSHSYGVTMPATTAVLHPSDPTQLLLTVPSTQPKTSRDPTTRPFLQTFDIRNARHISRQALSRNNITDFHIGPEQTPILPPDVSQIAVSADGKWLATVDEWIMPGSDLEHAVAKTSGLGPADIIALKEQQARRREVYLKFWRWDAVQGIWTLSTRADGPHDRAANADLGAGAGSVLRLESDPSSNGFATVGQDGYIKLWKPQRKIRHGVLLKEEDGSDFIEWTCRKTVTLPVTAEVDDDQADSAIEMSDETDESSKILAAQATAERTLSVMDAALAFSPDGSMIACSTTTTNEPMHPLVHFIDPVTGSVTATKSGIMPSDQEVMDLGFLDRYLVALTYGSLRVWNLIEDSHQYTITLPGDVEDQRDAKLAINHTDETFAVVHTIPSDEDAEIIPHIAVYSAKRPEVLYEADLECSPNALLTGRGKRGYTILFEDGTIRTLSSAVPTSKDRRLSFAFDATEVDVAAIEEDATSASALALLQTDEEDVEMQTATAQLSIGDTEDDRPVVRPEQLASIFDVGQSYALPPVRDMFQAVAGLYARKPRNGGNVADVDAMELA